MKNQISNDSIVKDLLADLDEAKRLIRFIEFEIQHTYLYEEHRLKLLHAR
jgi:hypothetical protein